MVCEGYSFLFLLRYTTTSYDLRITSYELCVVNFELLTEYSFKFYLLWPKQMVF
jgi:hypothetical protein